MLWHYEATRKHRSQWLRGSLLRCREILGHIACVPSNLIRGLLGLWSPCIGIRAPYPYTTLLALFLALALALAILVRHLGDSLTPSRA